MTTQRHRRREPAPRRARGRPRRRPLVAAHRRPARAAARHRRQPDHRPGGHLRGAVRLHADVPPPHPGTGRPSGARSSLAGPGGRPDVARAAGARPGPVHLNLQLDEPARPPTPADGWSSHARRPARTTSRGPSPGPRRRARARGLWPTGRARSWSAGDDAGPPARVLAEAGGLAAARRADQRLAHRRQRDPDLPAAARRRRPRRPRRARRRRSATRPCRRPVTRLLARDDVEVVVAPAASGVADPAGPGPRRRRGCRRRGPARPAASATPGSQEWLRRATREVGAPLDAFARRQRADLTPHDVAGERRRRPARRAGCSSSGRRNPIRDLDLMVPRYPVGRAPHGASANRGLAGIDGTVSSAIGAALGRPRSDPGDRATSAT